MEKVKDAKKVGTTNKPNRAKIKFNLKTIEVTKVNTNAKIKIINEKKNVIDR